MATTIAATSNSLLASLLSNIDSHIGRQNQDLATGDPGKVLNGKKTLTLLGFADPEPPQKYNIFLRYCSRNGFLVGKTNQIIGKPQIQDYEPCYPI